MTKGETADFLGELMTLYPSIMKSRDDLGKVVELWHESLKDFGLYEIHAALIKYFQTDTKGYVPTAGQLIELTKEEPDPYVPPDHEYYPPEVFYDE